MSMSLIAGLLLIFQSQAANQAAERPSPPGSNASLKIWEELAQVESELLKTVNKEGTQFLIAGSDPVRGYFIENVGVMILVPVRFRGMGKSTESRELPQTTGSIRLGGERIDIERQMREWREWLKREETVRDVEFEKVVTRVRELIPMALSRLKHLEEGAGLTVIIEEREPAWYASHMTIQQRDFRKIVTLQVAKEIIAKVHANETIFPREWLNEIKRTTNNRGNTRF